MSMPRNRAASKHSGRGLVSSGGGIKSLKAKNIREATRERPKVRSTNTTAVAQFGTMQGNHATRGGDMPIKREPLYSGQSFQPCEFGNTKALEGAGSGAKPGGGKRTVYKTGYQSLHGNPVQGAKDYAPDAPATTRGPDIHSMYGPERTIKR